MDVPLVINLHPVGDQFSMMVFYLSRYSLDCVCGWIKIHNRRSLEQNKNNCAMRSFKVVVVNLRCCLNLQKNPELRGGFRHQWLSCHAQNSRRIFFYYNICCFIRETGSVQKVFSSPSDDYTKSLLLFSRKMPTYHV